jgi:hypothetical protein
MALQNGICNNIIEGEKKLPPPRFDQCIWSWHHDQGNDQEGIGNVTKATIGIGVGNVTKATSRIEQDSASWPRLVHSIQRELKRHPVLPEGRWPSTSIVEFLFLPMR